MSDLPRKLAAEFLGTAFLLIAVVGSGIMAERLSGGNTAIALLANAIATGAALVVLIRVFAPVSGAHFNPAVSAYFALRGEMTWRVAVLYTLVQLAAAITGVWLAHAMFGMPVLETSHRLRDGGAQWLAEFVATFGLLLTIVGGSRNAEAHVPTLVGLYITGAYWFTASTAFANPAVTVARMLTDSFSGIAPSSTPGFIAAQIAAVLAGAMLLDRLFRQPAE